MAFGKKLSEMIASPPTRATPAPAKKSEPKPMLPPVSAEAAKAPPRGTRTGLFVEKLGTGRYELSLRFERTDGTVENTVLRTGCDIAVMRGELKRYYVRHLVNPVP